MSAAKGFSPDGARRTRKAVEAWERQPKGTNRAEPGAMPGFARIVKARSPVGSSLAGGAVGTFDLYNDADTIGTQTVQAVNPYGSLTIPANSYPVFLVWCNGRWQAMVWGSC
jgi:hypothetical protein